VNVAELNIISLNDELRQVAVRQYLQCLRLAHDLGAACLVLPSGRRALRVVPPDVSRAMLLQQLESLLPEAARLGVKIALETMAFGFLGAAEDVAAVVDHFGDENLGICYDCTNSFVAGEEPAAGVAAAGRRLLMMHVSDCWRSQHAHTSIGTGEIDFAALAIAANRVGFAGTSVYELVDAGDPRPRLAADLARLTALGWSL